MATVFCFRIRKGGGKTDAFDWFLSHAVEFHRRRNADHFIERRHDVNDVNELFPESALILDPRRPRDDHRVPCAAEMASDLLGPLKRGVHCVRPGSWKMVVVFG